jgi:integrase
VAEYPFVKTFSYDNKRYKVYGKTLEDALEKKFQKLQALKEGTVILEPSMLVKVWAGSWLETYKEPHISKKTLEDYHARLNNFILPAIGGMRVQDVKSSNCQKILNGMSGYSHDRITKVRNCMKQLFERAVIDNLIKTSPVIGLQIPKSTDGTRRSISAFERKITLQVAEYHHAGPWVLTMLYCGLRPQETAALQGRHIDRKNMVIHIEQALKRDGNIAETKTTSGMRDVPLPVELLKFFQNIDPFDYVFTSSGVKKKDGMIVVAKKPLTNNSMGDLWHGFKREMQIAAGCGTIRNKLIPPYPIADDLVPYCYRHTFCTDLQDAGIPINVAKDLMGHANISVTAKIYTHMTDTQLKITAEKLSAYRMASKTT